MSATNDWKEQNIDNLYDWVNENKSDEAYHYCQPTSWHADDDWENYLQKYIEDNEQELWEEYIATLP